MTQRPRLFARLDENRGRPLIWIDSPPGSGKTSLVASYLEARAISAIWYTIEPADDDPANVFHYLTLAVRGFTGELEVPLPRYAPECDLVEFARLFFRELFTALPERAVLVFDNYQEMSPASATHGALRMAVSQAPPGGSVLCVSRTDLPTCYVPLAGAGGLCALRWDSLQFTLEETRALTLSRGVTEDSLVHELHAHSDGWAAGLTLMLERLGQPDSHTAALPSDTREASFDYFATLLFDQLPETATHVLRSVAYLPYVSTAAAAELSGQEDAGKALLDLHRARLFVDRRPGEFPVYVFHAMFRDDLLDGGKDSEAAIPLRIAAKDWDGLTRTLLPIADHLLVTGRHETLEQWISALPKGERDRNPMLLYWQGVGRAQSSVPGGVRLLERALEGFEENGDVEGRILCLTALLQFGYVAVYVGLDSMDQWIDALLALVPGDGLLQVPPIIEMRIWGALCSALMLIRPWHPWVRIAAQRVLTLLNQGSDPAQVLPAVTSALDLAAARAEFDLCEELIRYMEPLLHSSEATPSEVCWAWYQLGYLRLYQARYEQAWECAERARVVAEAHGMAMNLVQATTFRAMVEFRRGNRDVAASTLQATECMPPPRHAMGIAYLRTFQAKRALAQGQPDKAGELADEAYRAIVRTRSPHQRMIWGASCGEVLLAAGRIDRARSLIRDSRAILDGSLAMHDSHSSMIDLAEAALAHKEGNDDLAVSLLRDALQNAQVGGRKYFLRFLDFSMPVMFAIALEHDIHTEFVCELVRMFRLSPPGTAPDSWPWPIRIHTLGRFDVTVHDRPLEFSRKQPRKTLALLKIIIAYGGQNVTEESVCDALWPDDEADAAREALKITILRLRKLLGIGEAIAQQGGRISLERKHVWVDVWSFERDLAAADDVKVQAAFDLYRGQFLPEDASAPWTVTARERLRGRFIHALAAHGAAVELQARHEQAQALYLRGIDADPIVEAFHQGLMRCYQAQHRHLEALSAFRRLRQMLSAVLGVPPSAASRQLYETSARAIGRDDTHDPDENVLPISTGQKASRGRP